MAVKAPLSWKATTFKNLPITTMISEFDIRDAQETITRLKEELHILRNDIIGLMPDDLAQVLTDYRECNSRRDFDSWWCGAIEIIIQSAEKHAAASANWSRRCLSRAKASGRRFGSYTDRLFYSQHEIKLILKGRSPYISLHDMGHFDHFVDSRYEVLFKTSP